MQTRVSPEDFLAFLILLSEFGEGSILLLKSLNLNLQFNQSLPQKPRLNMLAWGEYMRVCFNLCAVETALRFHLQSGKDYKCLSHLSPPLAFLTRDQQKQQDEEGKRDVHSGPLASAKGTTSS